MQWSPYLYCSIMKTLTKVNITNKVFGDGIDMKETPPIQRRKVPIVKKGTFLDFKYYAEDFFLMCVIKKEAIAVTVCCVKVEEEMKAGRENVHYSNCMLIYPSWGRSITYICTLRRITFLEIYFNILWIQVTF